MIKKIIQGNIEALEQGRDLLKGLSDEQYSCVVSPLVSSSIGQHIRHVADVFLSVSNMDENGNINYDLRRRGHDIEVDRHLAIVEFGKLLDWMQSFGQRYERGEITSKQMVITEVSLKETESVELQSSIERELIFASSHAVHHFALIGIIAKAQGLKIDETFGIAPATASFLRQTA